MSLITPILPPAVVAKLKARGLTPKPGLPRDVTCWHCQRGKHDRCIYRDSCACRPCLVAEGLA